MPWRWPWRRVCASWRDTGPMYQAERSEESNLAEDMVLGPGMGGVCCSRLLGAFTRCPLWGRGRASWNTSRNNQRAWSGRSSRLQAPQHPPPPPSCTGPPHEESRSSRREPHWAKLRGRGGRSGAVAEAATGFSAIWSTREAPVTSVQEPASSTA